MLYDYVYFNCIKYRYEYITYILYYILSSKIDFSSKSMNEIFLISLIYIKLQHHLNQ